MTRLSKRLCYEVRELVRQELTNTQNGSVYYPPGTPNLGAVQRGLTTTIPNVYASPIKLYYLEPVAEIAGFSNQVVSSGECYLLGTDKDGNVSYRLNGNDQLSNRERRIKVLLSNPGMPPILAPPSDTNDNAPDSLAFCVFGIQDTFAQRDVNGVRQGFRMWHFPIVRKGYPVYIGTTAITARSGSPGGSITPGSGIVDLYHLNDTKTSMVLLKSGVPIYNWAATNSVTSKFGWADYDGDGNLWLNNEECP